jgi:hypothetical protein
MDTLMSVFLIYTRSELLSDLFRRSCCESLKIEAIRSIHGSHVHDMVTHVFTNPCRVPRGEAQSGRVGRDTHQASTYQQGAVTLANLTTKDGALVTFGSEQSKN